QAGLQRDRYLAHRLQSRDGLAGGHHRMVQGLVAAAVPVAARRRRPRTISCRLHEENHGRLQTAVRRKSATALPTAIHRRGAVNNRYPPFTQTLVAIGPVSPMSST